MDIWQSSALEEKVDLENLNLSPLESYQDIKKDSDDTKLSSCIRIKKEPSKNSIDNIESSESQSTSDSDSDFDDSGDSESYDESDHSDNSDSITSKEIKKYEEDELENEKTNGESSVDIKETCHSCGLQFG